MTNADLCEGQELSHCDLPKLLQADSNVSTGLHHHNDGLTRNRGSI